METVQPDHEAATLATQLAAPPTAPRRAPLWQRVLRRAAPLIVPVLHCPLHRILSRKIMLVTVKGRRTETIYTFPVRYLEIDALVVALAPNARHRTWWRNFTEPSYASITIRGGRTAACGFAPAPDSPEFAKAAEQYLRQSWLVRRFFKVKLKKDQELTTEQAIALGEHTRVVIFDRAQTDEVRAAAARQKQPRTAALAPGAAAATPAAAPETESAELRLADLIGPLLAELEREERPAALALAERVSAERYRMWAKDSTDPTHRAALADCAVREDDIAARVEAAVPGSLAIQESIARAHPNVAIEYLEMFSEMPLREQLSFQASLQRAAAESWRFLAETSPPHIRGVLLECSYLEEKNAAVLDELAIREETAQGA